MNDTHAFDEIDRIVDRVIQNPDKAARLKEALHSTGLTARLKRPVQPRVPQSYDESVDDLWDNVPV